MTEVGERGMTKVMDSLSLATRGARVGTRPTPQDTRR